MLKNEPLTLERPSELREKSVTTAMQRFIDASPLGSMNDRSWVLFFDFVVESYKVKRISRPSISELCNMLKDKGFKKPGSLSVLYGQGLCILARKDGLKVYGENFTP